MSEMHTPFGAMKKETVFIAGGAVLILGLAYYHSRKASQAAAIAASGANTGIDPATGYAYGSAEDAAALTNQGNYINPAQAYPSGGSSYVGTSPGTFTSNAAWAQAAESYLTGNGMVSDASALGNALGKYLTGQPVTPDMQSLIQQAIAVEGYPPVPGPAGYPPSINTAPVSSGPGKLPAPTAVSLTATVQRAQVDWAPVPGAGKYDVYWQTKRGSTGAYGTTGTSASAEPWKLGVGKGDWIAALIVPRTAEGTEGNSANPRTTIN